MASRRDQRTKNPGVEDPRLLDRAEKLLARRLDLDLKLARVLAEVETKKAYTYVHAARLSDWVARSGVDGTDAWKLLSVGRALEHHEALEARVRSGKVPLPSAVGLGRALAAKRRAEARAKRNGRVGATKAAPTREEQAKHVTPDAELLKKAETQSPDHFKETADAEVESRAAGTRRGERVSLYTSKAGLLTFRRACELASRSAGRTLTTGQAFDLINDEFLRGHQPDGPGLGTRKRRKGDTSNNPADREVPAETRAEVFRRAGGDCCEFPGCTNRVYLQWAHVGTPNALGGGQEARETARLCVEHHRQFDLQELSLVGWTRGGRPVFGDGEGQVFLPARYGKPCRRPPKGAVSSSYPPPTSRQGMRRRTNRTGGRSPP